MTLVEHDPRRARAIRAALTRTAWPRGADVWLEARGWLKRVPGRHARAAPAPRSARVTAPRSEVTRRPAPVSEPLIAPHVRLGVTRAGPDLKVTLIGEAALECSQELPYPADLAQRLLCRVADEVVRGGGAERRAAMASIGEQLRRAFVDPAHLDGDAELGVRGAPLLLRLDRATVQLPWELLRQQGRFMSRVRVMSRQLEARAPGRTAPLVENGVRLKVLVIGDPAGDLPAARAEAESVTRTLRALPRVEVKALVGNVGYREVSRALDGDRFDIVHYAGHAAFDPSRGSVLGLGRGDAMTAEDLSTRRFLPRLFFGNACRAAESGSELDLLVGILPTLITGLLSAGVRLFIGAQWPVDDQAARTFATTFYRALVAGCTVGEATRRGRRSVVDAHGESEPAWASYALYGAPWLTVV